MTAYDPCDLSTLDPQARDHVLVACLGWACRWPYQPSQRGRSPLALQPATDRWGHIEGTDRYYDSTSPREPLAPEYHRR